MRGEWVLSASQWVFERASELIGELLGELIGELSSALKRLAGVV